jgi:hypothetical protein
MIRTLTQKNREKIYASVTAWQHLGVDQEIPQNPRSLCLLTMHNSTQVRDLLRIAERLNNTHPRGVHFPIFSCHCDECADDRAKGCPNPQHCAIEAQRRLDKITPKLNPNRQSFSDNLSLTLRRKKKNAEATKKKGDIVFDPSVTAKTNLAECY